MAKFVTSRDINFFQHVANELITEIMETPIVIFKMLVYETESNIYGESSNKSFAEGVIVNALITHEEPSSDINDIGIQTTQTLTLIFLRDHLRLKNLFPENGDIVFYNLNYYMIDHVIENQFTAGRTYYKLGIQCNCHLTNVDGLGIVEPMR